MTLDRKIVFFDIDGTILDIATQVIPQSAVDAIRRMRANGHYAVICTGRPFPNVPPCVREIGFDAEICACGAHILVDGATAFFREVEPALAAHVRAVTRKYRVDALFESVSGTFCDGAEPSSPHIQLELSRLKPFGAPVHYDIDGPDFRFEKFCAWFNARSDRAAFEREVTPFFEPIVRGADFLELPQKGISKASGIAFLLEYLSVPHASSFAFGDSANDIAMFNAVSTSVLMGGGDPALEAFTSLRTETVLRDGLKSGLSALSLI
ncbi:MAG: HAD family hydrolase [Clostridia bacterium]|nr:HAD family hydrolase [Clostridia bacterium]